MSGQKLFVINRQFIFGDKKLGNATNLDAVQKDLRLVIGRVKPEVLVYDAIQELENAPEIRGGRTLSEAKKKLFVTKNNKPRKRLKKAKNWYAFPTLYRMCS